LTPGCLRRSAGAQHQLRPQPEPQHQHPLNWNFEKTSKKLRKNSEKTSNKLRRHFQIKSTTQSSNIIYNGQILFNLFGKVFKINQTLFIMRPLLKLITCYTYVNTCRFLYMYSNIVVQD
jgi:hypothetical protein